MSGVQYVNAVLPRGKSVADLPPTDKVGDQLQEAVTQAAKEWGPDKLTPNERGAIKDALEKGKYWLARLLEREARGRYVHAKVKDRFEGLFRFNHQGADVLGPSPNSAEPGAAWQAHGGRVLPDDHLLRGAAMGWLENVIFRNQEIENERLELTDKNSLYFLSTHLTLKNCTVVLKVPARNLIIKQACFIDCTFEVKQELKNHQSWVFASLKGCRFKGNLSGCDFGHWPGYAEGSEHGSIEDCDFTEARMDGCRIMGCDPATLRFPRWPCFTLLDPIGNSRALNSVPWPRRFGRVVIDDLADYPAGTRALTFHAPSQAKRYDTTPEALQAVLEQFDCIVS